MIKVAFPGGGKPDFIEQGIYLKNSLVWKGGSLHLLLGCDPKLAFTTILPHHNPNTTSCLRAEVLVLLRDQLS